MRTSSIPIATFSLEINLKISSPPYLSFPFSSLCTIVGDIVVGDIFVGGTFVSDINLSISFLIFSASPDNGLVFIEYGNTARKQVIGWMSVRVLCSGISNYLMRGDVKVGWGFFGFTTREG
jgi:hypothetical protein